MGNTQALDRDDNSVSSPPRTHSFDDDQKKRGPKLLIYSKTWNKNSFGLFDYESRDVQKKSLKVRGTCKLMRNQITKESVEVEALNEPHHNRDQVKSENEQQLARLLQHNSKYWIYHSNQVDTNSPHQAPEDKLWLVIRKYHPKGNIKGFKIAKNDILKFGRVRLRVRDIDNADRQAQEATPQIINQDQKMALQRRITQDAFGLSQDGQELEFQEQDIVGGDQFEMTDNRRQLFQKLSKKKQSEQMNLSQRSAVQCRICWGTAEEETNSGEFNPLISPCKCTGSISSIHLKCLKEWIDTKKSIKTHRGQVVVKFKNLECELCKELFPFQYTSGDKTIDLVEIEKPQANFIILESLGTINNTQSTKVFYIVNTESRECLKIGRGQESDIRITDDISVSRCHALIRKTAKGDYYLDDFESKFGTLVQVQYPMLLSTQEFEKNQLTFQSGKTCFTVEVKTSGSCMPSCFRPAQKEDGERLVTTSDGRHQYPIEFTNQHQSVQINRSSVLKQLTKKANEDAGLSGLERRDFQNQSVVTDREDNLPVLNHNQHFEDQFEAQSRLASLPAEDEIQTVNHFGVRSISAAQNASVAALDRPNNQDSQQDEENLSDLEEVKHQAESHQSVLVVQQNPLSSNIGSNLNLGGLFAFNDISQVRIEQSPPRRSLLDRQLNRTVAQGDLEQEEEKDDLESPVNLDPIISSPEEDAPTRPQKNRKQTTTSVKAADFVGMFRLYGACN